MEPWGWEVRPFEVMSDEEVTSDGVEMSDGVEILVVSFAAVC